MPGQPIANPVAKADGKWHRNKHNGLYHYSLNAGDMSSHIEPYAPASDASAEASRYAAEVYEIAHRQPLPKGTKYILTVMHAPGGFHTDIYGTEDYPSDLVTAHKTLTGAKKAAEREMRRRRKQIKDNPTGDLRGYERTKHELKSAANHIDAGNFRAADAAIRNSGASRVDISNILGKSRLAKMVKWARASRAHGVL